MTQRQIAEWAAICAASEQDETLFEILAARHMAHGAGLGKAEDALTIAARKHYRKTQQQAA